MSPSRQWLLLVAGIALMGLIYLLAPVITPFAVAAGLAYVGDPLVDRLQQIKLLRWQCSRTLAVVLVFLLLLLVMGLVILLIIPLLIEQVRHLVERTPDIFAWLVDTAGPWVQAKIGLESSAFDADGLKQALRDYWKELSGALFDVMGSVTAGGQAVAGWFMNLLLIPVVTFYLLRDWDRLVEGVRTLLPVKSAPAISRLVAEMDQVMGAFARGQLMVMIALGVIYTLGLLLVGVNWAFAIGMIAGLLSIVPYLGTLVGVIAALIAALFQFQDALHPLLVLLVFGLGQMLEGMVLTPRLVGEQVGLHPVAVIFAVLAGGQLFGFLGILLALPFTAAVNVLVRYAHQRYRDSTLFGEHAVPLDDA